MTNQHRFCHCPYSSGRRTWHSASKYQKKIIRNYTRSSKFEVRRGTPAQFFDLCALAPSCATPRRRTRAAGFRSRAAGRQRPARRPVPLPFPWAEMATSHPRPATECPSPPCHGSERARQGESVKTETKAPCRIIPTLGVDPAREIFIMESDDTHHQYGQSAWNGSASFSLAGGRHGPKGPSHAAAGISSTS